MNVLQKEPAAPTLSTTVKEWAEMIKLEHTVFALPFALSGMILADSTIPPLVTWVWTIVAFAGARAGAMTLNRLIDSEIDARNPRTKSRAIPEGRIKRAQAALFALGAFTLMLAAASQLPPICLYLSPIALFWLSFYSFTKRFTWLCHIVLGIALGGAALGGWVASAGAIHGSAPWLLALAVTTWVAGFDIIYALQDVEIDRAEKLHSIPKQFGVAKALVISRSLHVVTVLSMLALGLALSKGVFFWSGVLLIAVMLAYEHSLVKPTDLTKINAAFFNVNGVVSILAFITILLDRVF